MLFGDGDETMIKPQALKQGARWLPRTIAIILVVLIFIGNLRLYSPVEMPAKLDAVAAHLHYARAELDRGLALDMQRLFPEGYFFSYILYGLTWVNVAQQLEAGSPQHHEALAEARWALKAVNSPAGRSPFSSSLVPAYGGFYVGWSNYLRAGIVRAQTQPNSDEVSALLDTCDQITKALDETDGPFLASYPGQTWPVDTYPAMVSVAVCEHVKPGRYRSVVGDWLDEVDQTIDQDFGLVAHRTEPYIEHPRATSQTLIVRFLAELDQERAKATYRQFKKTFVTSRLGLPGIREHPRGIAAGGDIDSGPLFFGISASASVVAIASAQANGDPKLASALRQTVESIGLPLSLPGGRRYALGVLPLGDLFVIWAATSATWLDDADSSVLVVADSVPIWWRWPTHLLSFLALLIVWIKVWPKSPRRDGA